MTFLNFEADSPEMLPTEIRSVLPYCRTKEYATWKLGQPFCAMEPITWNTWTRAFDKEAMFNSDNFEVMLGESMCNARATGKMGTSYVVILPCN